jgi:hypothetical protein
MIRDGRLRRELGVMEGELVVREGVAKVHESWRWRWL